MIADGNYQIRVNGTDMCGNTKVVTRNVTVDNTDPIAEITSPVNCSPVEGVVSIMGTASDAHLASWELHYTGGDSTDWTPIDDGIANVVDGLLADWDTTELPLCCYTIRLRVRDQAVLNCLPGTSECDGANITEYYATVNTTGGLCCDANHDGLGDGNDIQPFVDCLMMGVDGCP
jgi:hypothetical protein